MKTAEELAAEIKAANEKAIEAVKAIAEDALGKAKAGEALSQANKERADEALLKLGEVATEMKALEQKLARDPGKPETQKSLGSRFVEDENVKQWLAGNPRQGKADIEIKATLTSLTTDAAGSVGDAIQATRLPGIQSLPQRRMTVRALLMPGQMDGSTIEYVQETGFTNSAAPVAEGAAKPSSDIKLDLLNTPARVIAHWFKSSKQVLSDIPQLRSLIDNRINYGLQFVEEQQILKGDGTGQNLDGLVPNATAYAAPGSLVADNVIDKLRLAALQVALAEYPADGFVLNPIDWAAIELLKDDMGRYLIGNPQGTLAPTLWNLPVVATPSMTQNEFLVGAFGSQAQIFDRWQSRIEVGYVNDDFIRNLVTILGEERVALAIYRPEAFVTGEIDEG